MPERPDSVLPTNGDEASITVKKIGATIPVTETWIAAATEDMESILLQRPSSRQLDESAFDYLDRVQAECWGLMTTEVAAALDRAIHEGKQQ